MGGLQAAVSSMATGVPAKVFNPAAIVSWGLKGNDENVTSFISINPKGIITPEILTFIQKIYGYNAPGQKKYVDMSGNAFDRHSIVPMYNNIQVNYSFPTPIKNKDYIFNMSN